MKPQAAPARANISMKQHETILDYVQKKSMSFAQHSFNLRHRLEMADRLYQRELDYTRAQAAAKASNLAGDPNKIQNAVVPVVQPQVESQLTYLAEIFLSGNPLFPIVSKPQLQGAALQMETAVDNQATMFAWTPELLSAMRDALKYNLFGIEIDWEEVKTKSVATKIDKSIKYGVPEQVIQAGNVIKRRDPYNLILDTRVPPSEQHTRAEFCGYVEVISTIELKRRVARLDPTFTQNLDKAFASGAATPVSGDAGGTGYYVPQVNPQALLQPESLHGGVNWDAWCGLEEHGKQRYSGKYEWRVLYARILPQQFGFSSNAPNTAQVYKFIVINNMWVIYVRPMSNAHDFLPMIVGQAHDDGLGWQSKGLADTAGTYQQIATGLFNSGLESQRRKVYDRMLYDPSRVNKADIEKTSPVARIPVKPEAYGKNIQEAVYQIPYRDDNVNEIFNVANMVVEMADIANGQNRVQRGQFQRGNKSRKEFEETMSNSNARPRMVAMVLEARLFMPLKHIIKLNTLQYQMAGVLFNRQLKKSVEIDPAELRTAALEFKMADGMMPVDQLISFDIFRELITVAGQNPMIMQRYDLVGMIMYLFKQRGATWIDDFDLQQNPNPAAMPSPQMPPA